MVTLTNILAFQFSKYTILFTDLLGPMGVGTNEYKDGYKNEDFIF